MNLKNEMKHIKSELLEIKHKIGLKKEDSKGNEGVPTTLPQHSHNTPTTLQHLKNTENIDKNTKDLILSFTDREFLVFASIYQLEEELRRPVTYEEISLKLKLCKSHMRGTVGDLMSKQAPIIKKRTGNKIHLSITKEFKALKIGVKIMDFRRSLGSQTNLSDMFDL